MSRRPKRGLQDFDAENQVPEMNGNSLPKKRRTPAVKATLTDEELCQSMNQINIDSQSDIPWSEVYEPQTLDDVCLHHLQVPRIKSWFRRVYGIEGDEDTVNIPRILFLLGPSGSGKSTVIRAAAKDFEVSITEYSPEVDEIEDNDEFIFEDATEYDGPTVPAYYSFEKGNTYRSSQVKLFREFLLDQNRVYQTEDGDQSQRRLILIEEIPNAMYSQPWVFHQVLRNTLLKTFPEHIPIVFIHSYISSQEHFSEFNKLFPFNLREDLNAEEIKFNPVAKTFLKKALAKISLFQLLDNECVDSIIASSSGDLRTMFNSLEMMFRYNSNLGHKYSSQEIQATTMQRDCPVDMFNFFGKILHAKRVVPSNFSNKSSLLNNRELQRTLAHADDPNQLLRQSVINSNKMLVVLHQMYLKNVSKHEDEGLIEAAECADLLSTCDILSGHEFSSKTGYFEEYSCEIAVRGLLYHLTPTLVIEPQMKPMEGTSKPLLKQNSPIFYEARQKKQEFESEVREETSKSCCIEASALALDILSFFPQRESSAINFPQDKPCLLRKFLNDIGRRLDDLQRNRAFAASDYTTDSQDEEEDNIDNMAIDLQGIRDEEPEPPSLELLSLIRQDCTHIKGHVSAEEHFLYQIDDD